MENARKDRDTKLVTTERRTIDLLSEPSHHTANFFTKNLLATEMKKTQIYTDTPCLFRTFNTRIK